MRNTTNKQAVLFLGSLLLMPILAISCRAVPQPPDADAGGLAIELSTRPNPPVAGEMSLIVTIKEANQQPVEGAEVNLLASHASMASMLIQQKAENAANGEYSATFDFSRDSQGDWRVTVEVRNVQPQTIRKNFVISIP